MQLKLKKPKAQPNWFRSGRWHKVYPMPGRTRFGRGDLCQFKPDLLEVVVTDIYSTDDPNVLFYTVRSVMDGHEFSTYGNDLLLLQRHKPKLNVYKPKFPKKEGKPKLVFKPKPIAVKIPPVVLPGSWKQFVPDKHVYARLSYWSHHQNLWVWRDYSTWGITKEKEEKLELRYWELIEDERIDPSLISIEWFTPEENKSGNQGNASEVDGKHRGKKGAGRGGKRNDAGGTQAVLQKQGGAGISLPISGRSNTGGSGGGSGTGKNPGEKAAVPATRRVRRSLEEILKSMRRK